VSKLTFKYGAMNSGKSVELIRTAYNYEEAGLQVLVAKPDVDTRAGELVETRLKVGEAALSRTPDFLITPTMNIRDKVESLKHTEHIKLAMEAEQGDEIDFNFDALLIDEAQFLTEEHVNQLRAIATMGGISVVAYGLLTDFQTNLFPGSKRLVELADVQEVLITMCRCGSQARFNTRKIDGIFTFSGDQVAIDGDASVEYASLCARDYLIEKSRWEHNQKHNSKINTHTL
jgi:thymidine kinase